MNYTAIRYVVQDHILTITLDRPDSLNAVNQALGMEFIAALKAANEDDDVRVIVVTGAGRAFCAGADLSAGDKTFDYDKRDDVTLDKRSAPLSGKDSSEKVVRDGGALLSLQVFESTKPVIGAINGAAVGLGATLLLPMDIRIASDAAKFGFVFVRRGIAPDAASSWFLPRIVGVSQALEWCMKGHVFNAQEALRGGLVSAIYPADQLLEEAYKIAREIAENCAPVSVALTRQLLWRMLGEDHPMEAHKIESRAVYQRGQQADAKEGVMSFLQKRPASFLNKPSTDMPECYPWWEDPKYS
jgi:enoyl-CoA hydratase/carnithine racemase